MAIEKMKKLRLMAVRSQKEALLRDLLLLGCVQLTEPEQEMSDPSISAMVKREGSELLKYRAQFASLSHAVELVDKYAPVKTKALAPKPEIDCGAFLDDSSIETNLELADKITADDERIKRIAAEESRERGVIESLRPWETLDLPLECAGTEKTSAVMGILPGNADFGAVQASVAAVTQEAEIFQIYADKVQQCVVLVCFKGDLPKIQEALRVYSFAIASFGMTGTAAENIKASEKTLQDLADERTALIADITAKGAGRDELKLCADRLETKTGAAEAEDRIYGMDSAVAMEGWYPLEREPELRALLEKYDCAWESEDPDPEEYPEVPVKLKNNKFSSPLNMVTNMYSLPAYDGVDPNPLMAPFFILFYGAMMSDMAYGLIMVIAALLVLKKKKPTGGSKYFFGLLLECGISTFAWGIVTGSFFGDAAYQLAKMFNPSTTWTGLPALFSPVANSNLVLGGAMCFGLIQIITGMAVSFTEKVKAHEYLDAFFEEVTWWVVFLGVGLMVLGAGKVVLYIGCALVLAGPIITGKGLGKITGIFSSLYSHVTGYFGDILSYSRIMALMLAGSVIGSVFNTLGAFTGKIWFFIPIFLIGHCLNFALNLLGCYVHDMRLQCLEYFGKFYKDGGREFVPLGINSKYYNIVK
jgi:V/A-type H+-transporting ATPase subunit I